MKIFFFKDILIKIGKLKVHRSHLMEHILVNSTDKIKGKEKENFSGIMDKHTKEIGIKARDTVMVHGKVKLEVIMKENGSKEDSKEVV